MKKLCDKWWISLLSSFSSMPSIAQLCAKGKPTGRSTQSFDINQPDFAVQVMTGTMEESIFNDFFSIWFLCFRCSWFCWYCLLQFAGPLGEEEKRFPRSVLHSAKGSVKNAVSRLTCTIKTHKATGKVSWQGMYSNVKTNLAARFLSLSHVWDRPFLV